MFDVFRLQPDGTELHVGEAASHFVALLHLEMIAARVPAKYAIRDRETGQRHVVNLQHLGSSSHSRLTG